MDRGQPEVLICGAGACGLTLAIDLARRNIRFRIIDKAEGPFRGSRGKGVQPRTQEIFEDLGVLDRVVGQSGLYPNNRRYREGGYDETPVAEGLGPTAHEPYMMALLSPQFLTEAALRERLTELGRAPEFGCELSQFTQDKDGVSATLVRAGGGTEEVRVFYLVGADGGRSFVRQALDINFLGETLNARAIVADVMIEGVSADAWHRWSMGSPLQLSLCPLRGTDLFVLQGGVPLEGDIDLSAEGLTVMITERTGRPDIVVRSVSWASAFNMNARLADRYQVGRVFLAGDAAHVHPPTGGQGLNTSVQDAYNLGWKLAAVVRGAPPSLLETYEAERRPVAAGVLGLSTDLLKASRDRGEWRRGREVHQLDIGYPTSTLSVELTDKTRPVQPGDRAPDAPCRGVAGQATRLFQLFNGPHWTLIGYGVERTAGPEPRPGLRIHAVGPRGDLIDEGDHIRDAYGAAPGDWLLVRPDGYLAAIIQHNELDRLDAYFDRVGVRPSEAREEVVEVGRHAQHPNPSADRNA